MDRHVAMLLAKTVVAYYYCTLCFQIYRMGYRPPSLRAKRGNPRSSSPVFVSQVAYKPKIANRFFLYASTPGCPNGLTPEMRDDTAQERIKK